MCKKLNLTDIDESFISSWCKHTLFYTNMSSFQDAILNNMFEKIMMIVAQADSWLFEDEKSKLILKIKRFLNIYAQTIYWI